MQAGILGEVKSIGIERTTICSGFQLSNSWILLGCVTNNTSFHTCFQCSNGFWVMNQRHSKVLCLSKTQKKSIQKRWSQKQSLEQIIMVNRERAAWNNRSELLEWHLWLFREKYPAKQRTVLGGLFMTVVHRITQWFGLDETLQLFMLLLMSLATFNSIRTLSLLPQSVAAQTIPLCSSQLIAMRRKVKQWGITCT